MQLDTVFWLAILIYSIVLHEAAHGYMANYLGDPTARFLGRLTLNPLKHIDPIGSVVLPALLTLSQSPFLFGWAKPVPYNPYNFQKGGQYAEALVAFAGPGANFLLALVFGLVIRVSDMLALPGFVTEFAFLVVLTNIMLGLFNLTPIPPLDGSKILSVLLPSSLTPVWDNIRAQLEGNLLLGLLVVFLFMTVFGGVFSTGVYTIAQFIAGV
jgi:Zn-dependent protease